MGISAQERSIQSLVTSIREGHLLLPEMQRKYVWKSTQVRDFFDSLYREYPTGHLLVWETDDLPFARDLSASGTEANQRRPQLLLDGQQRLTSLYAVMGGESVAVRERVKHVDIVFNVTDERFEVATAFHRPQGGWISLTKIFTHDPVDLLDELGLQPGSPETRDALRRMYRVSNIKEYRYRVHVLEGMTYNEVTEIFVRINSGGTRLNSADLALAQVSSRWRGVTEELDTYRLKVKGLGWELDDAILLRVLAAITTKQSKLSQFFHSGRERGGRDDLTVEKLQDGWRRAHPAMDQAIMFMKNNCLIDRLSMLPTYYVLVPLAVFFDQHGERISARQARDLRRWLYLALIWSRYSGATETSLDQDLNALFREEDPIGRMVQNIEDKVGQQRQVTERELRDQLNNSPYMLMAYVLARRNGAQDWFNGVAIGAGQELEYHHIFPKALLKGRYDLLAQSRIVNQVANLAFLSERANGRIAAKPPSDYLPAIEEPWLRAQYVLPMDRSLWELDRFEEFLLARRTLLADGINELLQSLSDEPAPQPGSNIAALKGRIGDVEEQLRTLIAARLTTSLGPAAWKQGMPGDIKQAIEGRIEQRELQYPFERGQYVSLGARLAFANFGDYARIIRHNWPLFADVFGNKQLMQQHFDSAQNVRNAFAHNREPNSTELAYAHGGLNWIEDCLRHAEAQAQAQQQEEDDETLAEVAAGVTIVRE